MSEIFWTLFMLSALQPIITRRLLEYSRRRLMWRIERERGSRVILLVHRQETMSFLGFPFFRYIDVNDSEEVIRAIHMTDPDVPLDIILHTPGGLVLASLQIAMAIKRHPGKVTAFVPHYAMSGGTLIALAADEIVMCEHAVLGPVDPQLGHYPAASILKAASKKPMEELEDETIILADQAEKAVAQLYDAVRELLKDKFPDSKTDELARLLSEGTWTHDYPLTYERARSLGLAVTAEMPGDIMKLMSLFPQPVRHTPSVEYLPIRRYAPAERQRQASEHFIGR
ncbi:MAG TPA: ATP-dependent Clp protease proteolytic subunit [candidate division Zixibacteria bacterium]|nr:ATP-dependent Clp protease proteolytic subunit [candidate division Zixibacteria bacterium]